MDQHHTLLRADQVWLSIAFRRRPATIQFTERRGDSYYWVTTPFTSLPALSAYFARRLGAAAGPPSDEDQLVAHLKSLVAAGELGPERPPRGNRDRVAAWFTEAGVPVEAPASARRETLLRTRRRSTDCVFTLSLSLDPAAGTISFHEHYDYGPRPGDSGREYAYGVRTPDASLGALIAWLEARLGRQPGEPEDQLVAGFTALVASGELGDGLALRENRDRVAGWFADAGVPAEPTDWHWFNSD